jgi:hypothetical protein
VPAPGAARQRDRRLRRLVSAALVAAALLTAPLLLAESRTDLNTDAGLVGLAVTNLGYLGNFLENPNQPSCEYPLNSNVEHLFLAGLWVGAIGPDDTVRVSTGAQDASNLLDGDEIREFDFPDSLYPGENYVEVWSNSQNSDNYDPRALATQHIEVIFEDYANVESGRHTPLGLRVYLRVLAWGNPYADDFVILDYAIVNVSGSELRDLYVGFWNDLTVGNTENTNPYDPNAPVGWDFWDDYDGALGAEGWVDEEYTVPGDPDIWLMYERDDDGEEGLATSWAGTRLLGTVPEPEPQLDTAPVSYHAWRFRNVPERDDAYEDEDGELQPGKYQLMSDGGFTRGTIDGIDYDASSNWVQMMGTGPFPTLAPGDTLRATFAMVCAPDSLGLLANSKVAQVAYDDGFTIPTGPPSPQLAVDYEWNSVTLRWAPGDSLDAAGQPLPADDPRRSPEQHISTITGKPDFQGYRVYRYQGLTIDQDPYTLATLVAQYDIIDGIGFDTGLPPLNDDGLREFTDTDLLDGFPYWYSVVSFSAPDQEEGLPEFQSGFNENARLIYPGPAAPGSAAEGRVGVAPNPYRAGSYFDNAGAGAELGRRIWFTNLPPRATIKIFTVAGDLVRTLEHDDPIEGKLAWDVLSEYGRAIASGLYVYTVKNQDSGEVQRGKLVIIK